MHPLNYQQDVLTSIISLIPLFLTILEDLQKSTFYPREIIGLLFVHSLGFSSI
jgi:hypothetical protein